MLVFCGLLRAGEVLAVCNLHFFMMAPDKPAVVSLGFANLPSEAPRVQWSAFPG